MEFSQETIEETWRAAQGRCQCIRTTHGHGVPHNVPLVYPLKEKPVAGGWFPCRISKFGGDEPENCQITCYECTRG